MHCTAAKNMETLARKRVHCKYYVCTYVVFRAQAILAGMYSRWFIASWCVYEYGDTALAPAP